jgi:hypothetical protein
MPIIAQVTTTQPFFLARAHFTSYSDPYTTKAAQTNLRGLRVSRMEHMRNQIFDNQTVQSSNGEPETENLALKSFAFLYATCNYFVFRFLQVNSL